MLLQIANILSQSECAAIREALTDKALWLDGKNTAKGAARDAKNNLQADPTSAITKGVIAKVERSLLQNTIFKAAAQPAKFARLMVNRFEQKMTYGNHVDAPYIEGTRSDLSVTVFLCSPKNYEGGELVIENAGQEDRIRGPLGSAVIYPSTAIHRVEPVTQGQRLACVGWVKSRVKSSDHRKILFELETAIANLHSLNDISPVRDQLANVRNNLLRTFGE